MFVIGKLLMPSLTNTLTWYENPLITDEKKFYNIGPSLLQYGIKYVKSFIVLALVCFIQKSF